MRKYHLTLIIAAVLAGCSFTEDRSIVPDYSLRGQLSNSHEFGTVISVDQDVHAGVHNVGTAVAGTAVNGTASAASGGMFSSIMPFDKSQAPTVGAETALHYVIRKDDGTVISIVQVPEEGEIIVYPGQRAMIQTNGQFTRVYPGNVEHRREE